MCYSGNWASVSPKELALRRRWHALQASMAAADYVRAQRIAAGDGGAGKRYCMCSPTQHPGSFRCRQHHGEYAWGAARVVRRTSAVVQ